MKIQPGKISTRYIGNLLIRMFILYGMGLIWAHPLHSREAEWVQKKVCLPQSEVERTLLLKIKALGFEIKLSSLTMGKVSLTGEKTGESCRFLLQPNSPLATDLKALFYVRNEPQVHQTEAFIAALFASDSAKQILQKEKREEGQSISNCTVKQKIPANILAKIETVVCIKAETKTNEIQFSGFFIDNKGIVLSTAHDLDGFKSMRVILYDGRTLDAQVVKMDVRRDLLLLQVDLKTPSYIHLSDGRQAIGMGESVYSTGCPLDLRGTVYAGVVNSLPRKADELPLWQVNIEIYPGSSGGPVFNRQGQLVAVVKGRFRGTNSIGFLIPMETIVDFLKE